MGTYWAFVGIMGAMGLYYLASAFISFPDWLAPRRFPGVFGLVTVFLPERWGMLARRVLMALVCFLVAAGLTLQALRVS